MQTFPYFKIFLFFDVSCACLFGSTCIFCIFWLFKKIVQFLRIMSYVFWKTYFVCTCFESIHPKHGSLVSRSNVLLIVQISIFLKYEHLSYLSEQFIWSCPSFWKMHTTFQMFSSKMRTCVVSFHMHTVYYASFQKHMYHWYIYFVSMAFVIDIKNET